MKRISFLLRKSRAFSAQLLKKQQSRTIAMISVLLTTGISGRNRETKKAESSQYNIFSFFENTFPVKSSKRSAFIRCKGKYLNHMGNRLLVSLESYLYFYYYNYKYLSGNYMKILLSYLKPYRWVVLLALFLATINQVFSMLDPYFFGKLGLDNLAAH